MRIEASRPADAPALTRIAHEAKRHWGYPERWIRRWRAQLTVTAAYVRANPTYGAVEGREIVGFCALRLDGDRAHVDHLWVIPAAMGRGVGRRLFRRCEERAARAGASRLCIESDPNAEGFYLAMGAAAAGRKAAPMDGRRRYLPLLEKRLG